MAGYSTRTLREKLGLKDGHRAIFLNPYPEYLADLSELPTNVKIETALDGQFDFIHFFTRSTEELHQQFPHLKQALLTNGSLWISWPKGSSKIPTDVNENIVREIGLINGLVDVKVCAVSVVWSGLKFVYRVKDRK